MSYNANSDWDDVYADIIGECGRIFIDKMADYGPTWLYFRDVSLVDQLWIKIKRVRTLEKNGGKNAVGEGSEGEFIAIINYAAIMLMKKRYPEIFRTADYYIDNPDEAAALPSDEIESCYREVCAEVCGLCRRKNHDYGAAWVEMHAHSITDQIIIRVLRIKSFLANGGPSVSEGMEAQLMDIINYSIFGLIKTRGIDAAEG